MVTFDIDPKAPVNVNVTSTGDLQMRSSLFFLQVRSNDAYGSAMPAGQAPHLGTPPPDQLAGVAESELASPQTNATAPSYVVAAERIDHTHPSEGCEALVLVDAPVASDATQSGPFPNALGAVEAFAQTCSLQAPTASQSPGPGPLPQLKPLLFTSSAGEGHARMIQAVEQSALRTAGQAARYARHVPALSSHEPCRLPLSVLSTCVAALNLGHCEFPVAAWDDHSGSDRHGRSAHDAWSDGKADQPKAAGIHGDATHVGRMGRGDTGLLDPPFPSLQRNTARETQFSALYRPVPDPEGLGVEEGGVAQ